MSDNKPDISLALLQEEVVFQLVCLKPVDFAMLLQS